LFPPANSWGRSANRLDDCLELLKPVLDLKSTIMPRDNISASRQGKPPPSPEARAKMEEMTSEDRRLFEYVSRAFDDLYPEFAGERSVAWRAATWARPIA
jgi:hypothetical protein